MMRAVLTSLGRVSLALSLGVLLTTTHPATAGDIRASRIVTIGGVVTEIAYALGQQDRLIARDTTSTFPKNTLPDIGYMRALSPEGVLSTDPDLIVAIQGSGPPETIEVLRAANVDFIVVPEAYTAEGIAAKILAVGAALDADEAAIDLARKVQGDIAAAVLAARETADGRQMRVLFILSAQNGRILASGTETAADSIIQLAGGINAATGFSGYKPMTDEAVTLAAPDVILMMTRGGAPISDDELFAMPALISTPAGQNRRAVRMSGLHLLGFGPRTGTAITELSRALHGAAG